MRHSFISAVVPACLVLTACACPHRKAVSLHEIEDYAGRSDGLVRRESWSDSEQGGGEFLFTDPSAAQLFASHTNQTALGGGSVFSAGSVSSTVDSNTAPIIGAAGTAAGNVIGSAVKSSVK